MWKPKTLTPPDEIWQIQPCYRTSRDQPYKLLYKIMSSALFRKVWRIYFHPVRSYWHFYISHNLKIQDGVRVIQSHWKWHHSIDRMRYPILVSRLQLDMRNLSLGRRHLVNAYEVEAGIGVIAANTVWSMPERLECEVLQKTRYINTLTFTFHAADNYRHVIKNKLYKIKSQK